jgi:hypothetical protein
MLQYSQKIFSCNCRSDAEGEMSEYFPCNIGVRQGENPSSFLFSIYLNDLQQFFEERNVCGLV